MDVLVWQKRVITVENSQHGYTSKGQLVQTFGKHAEFPAQPPQLSLFVLGLTYLPTLAVAKHSGYL